MFDHDSRTGNLRKKTIRRGESMLPELANTTNQPDQDHKNNKTLFQDLKLTEMLSN